MTARARTPSRRCAHLGELGQRPPFPLPLAFSSTLPSRDTHSQPATAAPPSPPPLTSARRGELRDRDIPDFRIDEQTLEQIRSDHERLLKKHPEFLNYCPNVLAYDLSFLNYARIPEILDLVESVLGPDFVLWNSSFFAKPVEKGQATPWHQDGEYWPIRPLATCTVWIAVDAANTENGCLQVIRGSHRSKKLFRHQTNPEPELTLNQDLLKEEFDESNAVSMELEAGMISLHDVYLVHGSAVNRSSRSRRGLTLRFMPTSSVFDREWSSRMAREKGLVDHAERTLFLMRGKDLSGENDFRLRW